MRDGRWAIRSAEIYRAMVRAAYPAIKARAPKSRVLVGGTAAMGSSTPGTGGVPPLAFLRAFACVDGSLQPLSDGPCAGFSRVPGDGWAHHPYSLRTTPDVDTRDTDKLPVAATARLAATLRALVAAGRIDPAMADVYLTEYGYETNPPDLGAPFSLADQGRLLAWAEYLAMREPAVRSWPQFQLYDRPDTAPRAGIREFGDWHSGLYFNDGRPKPAAATYGAPIFAACARGGRTAVVWGRWRGHAGTAVLERRMGGVWAAAQHGEGDAVTLRVAHRRGAAYRLRWTDGGGERLSAEVVPAAAGCRRVAKVARRR
jgi:hypothetical protein